MKGRGARDLKQRKAKMPLKHVQSEPQGKLDTQTEGRNAQRHGSERLHMGRVARAKENPGPKNLRPTGVSTWFLNHACSLARLSAHTHAPHRPCIKQKLPPGPTPQKRCRTFAKPRPSRAWLRKKRDYEHPGWWGWAKYGVTREQVPDSR